MTCTKCGNPMAHEAERELDVVVTLWHCRMCGRTRYDNPMVDAAIARRDAATAKHKAAGRKGGRPAGPWAGVPTRMIPCQCGTDEPCRRHRYGRGDERRRRHAPTQAGTQ